MLGALTAMACSAAHAENVYWLGDINGNGVWDTTTANWALGSPGGVDTTFTNGDNTFFYYSGGNLNLTEDLTTNYQEIGQSGGTIGLNYVFTSDVVDGVNLGYTNRISINDGNQATIGSGVTAIFSGSDTNLHIEGDSSAQSILNIDGGTVLKNSSSVLNLSNVTVNVINGGVLGGDAQGGTQIFFRNSFSTLNVDSGGRVQVGNSSGGSTQFRGLIVGVGAGGGGEVNIDGGRVESYNTAVLLGDNQASGTSATINLNGGVLYAPQVRAQNNNGGVTSTLNFNGGVLEVSSTNAITANYLSGITNVVVQEGGAIIDTNGQSITINQILTHDVNLGATADGGLTKQGVGTLTLNGVQAYTGNTTILGGTDAANLSVLSINSAFLADSSEVYIEEFGFLNLNFAGTDTITGLYLDGIAMAQGTWGASGSGADNINDTYFGGTGQLMVIPEVSSYAMILGGLSLALIVARRRKARG